MNNLLSIITHFSLFIIYLTGCTSHSDSTLNPEDTELPPIGEMVFVPGGEFVMGSPTDSFERDETPEHAVWVDGYYIGFFEVTNREYAQFLTAGGGEVHWDYRMGIVKSGDRYAAVPGREDYPVTYVNWINARACCEWIGGRLPTEAEWEKAARGPDDRRIYPWGDRITGDQANFSNSIEGLWPVGKAEGRSYYGCCDMAGNVSEWTYDWYDESYYTRSPYRNPAGPLTGEYKAVRGGSYLDDESELRCANRLGIPTGVTFMYIGFRCVIDSADFDDIRR